MPNFFIELLEGRTVEQKQQLVEGITELAVNILKTDPESVHIRFLNVKKEDWAKGGKLYIYK